MRCRGAGMLSLVLVRWSVGFCWPSWVQPRSTPTLVNAPAVATTRVASHPRVYWFPLAVVFGRARVAGAMKTDKNVRAVHKWLGRAATAAGWATCVLGFQKMDSDPLHQAAFAIPLLVMFLPVLS